MWQTIIVILIVAVAAGFVIRRLARQLSGKNAPCCGGEGSQSASCSGCAGPSAPGPLLNGAGQPCGCGCTPAPDKDQGRPEGETTPGARALREIE